MARKETWAKRHKPWHQVMMPTKDGSKVPTEEHRASFEGKNNISKGRVCLFLWFRWYRKNDHTKYGLLALEKYTGVSYKYLKTVLSTWAKWGYLDREMQENKEGKPTWKYCIGDRGRRFIEDIVPAEIIMLWAKKMQDLRIDLTS